ncbi:MAG: DNA helicase II, partial [Gammaproteobacteria bacterium]|nr:DNA helicase II [Gammaproteobacteria bacterium]
VGDDDQSIYGWRGAKIENIQRFSKEFPHVATIRLEQNYRSTQTILDAANHVIAHNRGRLGKNLWTAGEKGEPISVYAAFNELDEARFIAARIKTLMAEQPLKRSDFALLYRSNAQSRVLEEALIQAALPYRIYGGLRFFERAEIKDVLAYLRLIHNPDDDSAFERIVNTPARGIGDKSLEILRETARTQEVSLWVATNELLKTQALPSRAALALSHFLQLITTIGDQTEELPLHLQIDHIIQHSGLIPHYQKEPGEKGESRVENLQELVTAAREFKPQLSPEEPTSLVAAFLTHAALEAGEGQADEFEDSIQLMTMHAAKGLEFPVVFITGMEDELFPSRFQNDDPSKLEEERRLCYVAMTRAMKKLFFTYAENRRLYGESRPCIPSRFLREVPESCLQPIRLKTQISKPSLFDPSSRLIPPTPLKVKAEPGSPYRVGQRVRHAKFGEGVVINYEGKGELMRLQVNFGPQGIKWLMAAIANLETV